MRIAYVAHTTSCTFLLDEDGICLRVRPLRTRVVDPGLLARAARCVGAQYVASLSPGDDAGLVDRPRVGAPMLFARVDRNGRVSIARTGPLVTFVERDLADRHPLEATTERPADAGADEATTLETRTVCRLGSVRPPMHTPTRVFTDLVLPPPPQALDLAQG